MSVEIVVQSSHPVLPARLGCEVRLSGEVRAAEGGARLPLDLCYVLDRSGSMGGRKLEQLREAVLASLELAFPGDQLSLIAFANDARLLAQRVDGGNAEPMRRAVREMDTQGGTNMHAGIAEGIKKLNARKTAITGMFRRTSPGRRNRRLVVMTDGQANVGPHRLEDFERLAGDAKGQGIPVDTIGFGHGYSEQPLARISEITGADHRAVLEGEEASTIVRRFCESFRRGATMAASEAVVHMRLHPQVQVDRVFGPPGCRVAGREVAIPLGDIDAEPREFAVTLRASDLGPTDSLVLAEGNLDYYDLAAGRRAQRPFTVVVRTTMDVKTVRSSVNPDVVVKTRLIEGLTRMLEAGEGVAAEAATYTRTLHEHGLGHTEMARLTRRLAEGGGDSKLLCELRSRRDRGRTKLLCELRSGRGRT